MATGTKYLVDTSVLIASFRKQPEAKKALDSLRSRDSYICDITVLEMLAGCSTVEKREQTLAALDVFGRLLPVSGVFDVAIRLMSRYCIQSQPSLMLPDCIIAAFASYYKATLLTFNKKDFEFISGINIHSLSY